MTGSLETAIREAASDGRLSGLTLWPSGSAWQANARFVGSSGWRVAKEADPVLALQKALGAAPAPEPDPQPSGVFD